MQPKNDCMMRSMNESAWVCIEEAKKGSNMTVIIVCAVVIPVVIIIGLIILFLVMKIVK